MQSPSYRVVRPLLLLAPAALVLALAVVPTPHAQADAPPCRYTTTADTVLDRDTGLMWQRVVVASSYTWINAVSYCNGLTLAGYSDWRLPSIQELQTVVDESRVNPAIDTSAFPNTPVSDYFWSSSTAVVGVSPGAWVVGFLQGYVYVYEKVGISRVRCVR